MSLPDDHRAVDSEISVSGQIGPEQVADIAAAGYKSIICNRPDGEAPDQPAFALIDAAAKAAGLEIRYIPVAGSGITQDDVEATRKALGELQRPIYAYCRSGARSTNVYGLAVR